MKHVLNTKELHRLSKASMRIGLSKLQWGNGGKKGQVIQLFNHSMKQAAVFTPEQLFNRHEFQINSRF